MALLRDGTHTSFHHSKPDHHSAAYYGSPTAPSNPPSPSFTDSPPVHSSNECHFLLDYCPYHIKFPLPNHAPNYAPDYDSDDSSHHAPKSYIHPSPSPPPYYLTNMVRERPERPAHDPSKPHIPRPMNKFFIFRNEQIKEAIEKGLVGNALKVFTNETINQRWHQLSPQSKAKYVALAEKEKADHALKYPGYKYEPRTKEEKAAEKLYKADQRRKAQEAKAAAGGGSSKRRRAAPQVSVAPDSDDDIQEVKKEDVSPPRASASKSKGGRVVSSRQRVLSGNKYQFYSASCFGRNGPPPDWYDAHQGQAPPALGASQSQDGSNQMVFNTSQPMYAPPPMMGHTHGYHPYAQPPPVHPSLLSTFGSSLPSHPPPPPPLDEYEEMFGNNANDADDGQAPTPGLGVSLTESDGATPTSGRFSEPVCSALWGDMNAGVVNSSRVVSSEHFDDLVDFDGGHGNDTADLAGPSHSITLPSLPPPPPAVSQDYGNWKADDDDGSHVHLRIPETLTSDGGPMSQELADQMLLSMTMNNVASGYGSLTVDAGGKLPAFSFSGSQGDGSGNVPFNPNSTLLGYLPQPLDQGGVAYGGNVTLSGDGVQPTLIAHAPQLVEDPNASSLLWDQLMGTGLNFSSGDDQALDSATGQEFMAMMDLPGNPDFNSFVRQMAADDPNFFDNLVKNNNLQGDLTAPDAPVAVGQQPYTQVERVVLPDNNGDVMMMGLEDGDGQPMLTIGEMQAAALTPASEDIPQSAIYHHSPSPDVVISPHQEVEHTYRSFASQSVHQQQQQQQQQQHQPYVPPSGASNFSGRRAAGNWRAPVSGVLHTNRITSAQSIASEREAGEYTLGHNGGHAKDYTASGSGGYPYPYPHGGVDASYANNNNNNNGGYVSQLAGAMQLPPTMVSRQLYQSQSQRVVSNGSSNGSSGPPPPVPLESRPRIPVAVGVGASGSTYGR